MANPEHLRLLEYPDVDLWNRWRQENPNVLADCSGAKLGHKDFSAFDFHGANFAGADLTFATFSGTDLNGADLRDSRLVAANFLGARLYGADMTGAVLDVTVFADVDLSMVLGLDRVKHYGPSTIGIDTLFASKGRISDNFLRGTGVPQTIIEIARLLRSGPSTQFYSCFISYNHDDKAFACVLHDRLQNQGIRCWLDEHQLLPGDEFHERIDQGIRLWDKVLLCCSK